MEGEVPSLTPDVLLRIFRLLNGEKGTLAKVARCCEQFRFLVIPILYSDYKMDYSNNDGFRRDCELLERPLFGEHLVSLSYIDDQNLSSFDPQSFKSSFGKGAGRHLRRLKLHARSSACLEIVKILFEMGSRLTLRKISLRDDEWHFPFQGNDLVMLLFHSSLPCLISLTLDLRELDHSSVESLLGSKEGKLKSLKLYHDSYNVCALSFQLGRLKHLERLTLAYFDLSNKDFFESISSLHLRHLKLLECSVNRHGIRRLLDSSCIQKSLEAFQAIDCTGFGSKSLVKIGSCLKLWQFDIQRPSHYLTLCSGIGSDGDDEQLKEQGLDEDDGNLIKSISTGCKDLEIFVYLHCNVQARSEDALSLAHGCPRLRYFFFHLNQPLQPTHLSSILQRLTSLVLLNLNGWKIQEQYGPNLFTLQPPLTDVPIPHGYQRMKAITTFYPLVRLL